MLGFDYVSKVRGKELSNGRLVEYQNREAYCLFLRLWGLWLSGALLSLKPSKG